MGKGDQIFLPGFEGPGQAKGGHEPLGAGSEKEKLPEENLAPGGAGDEGGADGEWEALAKALGAQVAEAERGAGGSETMAQTAGALARLALLRLEAGHGATPMDENNFDDGDWGLPGGSALNGLPDKKDWEEYLEKGQTLWVPGKRDLVAPLVYDHGHLYLDRYFRHERRVANQLVALTGESVPPLDLSQARFKRVREALFPSTSGGSGAQKEAADHALGHGLTVVAGGPGTGKTYTVARLLALFLLAKPNARVAVAAPTGKAAARLNESIRRATEDLGRQAAEPVPEWESLTRLGGSTIHRLLGTLGGSTTAFRHHRGKPLALDLLVVDESSMMDLPLVSRLLDAVAPGTRLVLLGDRHQLASVEAGAFFGDLCTVAPMPSSPLHGVMVELTENRRSLEAPGIGLLAEAVKRGGDGEELDALFAAHPGDLSFIDLKVGERPGGALASWVGGRFSTVLSAPDVASRHRALEAVRILSPLRQGPWGADTLGGEVERHLGHLGSIGGSDNWYEGRPVMVEENDYNLGLFNGDVGVVMDGRVHFPKQDGTMKTVLPALLPSCRSAWALTVHKSQGSEFDEVLLVMPEGPSPLLVRELLYTAITRARKKVTVLGSRQSFHRGAKTHVARGSGLVARLQG